MRRQLLMMTASICLLLNFVALSSADFHLEVAEGGINMFQINLWADSGSPELTTPVVQAQAQTSFTNFMGVSGSQLVVSSVEGLNGFAALNLPEGLDFSMTRTFNAFNVSGGIALNDKDSPTNALPILKVTYNAAGAGMYDAAVLDPDGFSMGTAVNVDTVNVMGSTTPTKLSAVPEPSAFAMIGLVASAGFCIAYLRRRLRGTNS